MSGLMKLRNLKVSLYSSEPVFNRIQNDQKLHFNFDRAKLIIYKHSPSLLNLTGLRSFEELNTIKRLVETKFNIKIIKIKIDCCFFSHKQSSGYNIDLGAIYNELKNSKVYFVSYEAEIFAGLTMKPRNDKTFPSVLLFRTGSFTVIGGRSGRILKQVETEILQLREKYNRNGRIQ